MRALVEIVVLKDFLKLPEHMRGVEVTNEAGKFDKAWVEMYPGASPPLLMPPDAILRGRCLHGRSGGVCTGGQPPTALHRMSATCLTTACPAAGSRR